MKRILVRRPGSFDRLELAEEPDPVPGPGEVLVRIAAAGVNFADCVVRMGLYPSAEEYVGWPITPGFELSGEVEALGESSEPGDPAQPDLSVGQQVFGVSLFGAYATHVIVPARQLRPLPAALSLQQAAALPVPGLTAWYALLDKGAASEGKNVLVHSAAGGVGSILVQMAKIVGCSVVGVVGSPDKVDAVKQLGADLVIDKSQENLFEKARAFAPEGFDIILDANGVETLRGSYAALRPTGRLIVYGAHTMLTRGSGRRNWLALAWNYLRTPRFDPIEMTNANKSVLAFNMSYLFSEYALLAPALAQIIDWVESGRLHLPHVTCYPLAEAAQAHAELQSGTTIGKLVLTT